MPQVVHTCTLHLHLHSMYQIMQETCTGPFGHRFKRDALAANLQRRASTAASTAAHRSPEPEPGAAPLGEEHWVGVCTGSQVDYQLVFDCNRATWGPDIEFEIEWRVVKHPEPEYLGQIAVEVGTLGTWALEH